MGKELQTAAAFLSLCCYIHHTQRLRRQQNVVSAVAWRPAGSRASVTMRIPSKTVALMRPHAEKETHAAKLRFALSRVSVGYGDRRLPHFCHSRVSFKNSFQPSLTYTKDTVCRGKSTSFINTDNGILHRASSKSREQSSLMHCDVILGFVCLG